MLEPIGWSDFISHILVPLIICALFGFFLGLKRKKESQSQSSVPYVPFLFVRPSKNAVLGVWVLALLVFIALFMLKSLQPSKPIQPIQYSEFIEKINQGQISEVELKGQTAKVYGTEQNNISIIYTVELPKDYQESLLPKLQAKHVNIKN